MNEACGSATAERRDTQCVEGHRLLNWQAQDGVEVASKAINIVPHEVQLQIPRRMEVCVK